MLILFLELQVIIMEILNLLGSNCVSIALVYMDSSTPKYHSFFLNNVMLKLSIKVFSFDKDNMKAYEVDTGSDPIWRDLKVIFIDFLRYFKRYERDCFR